MKIAAALTNSNLVSSFPPPTECQGNLPTWKNRKRSRRNLTYCNHVSFTDSIFIPNVSFLLLHRCRIFHQHRRKKKLQKSPKVTRSTIEICGLDSVSSVLQTCRPIDEPKVENIIIVHQDYYCRTTIFRKLDERWSARRHDSFLLVEKCLHVVVHIHVQCNTLLAAHYPEELQSLERSPAWLACKHAVFCFEQVAWTPSAENEKRTSKMQWHA